MARINVASIPNAPGPGEPVLGPRVGAVRRAQPVDRTGAVADTGGLGRARSLIAQGGESVSRGMRIQADAIEGGRRSRINPNSFTAESEAIAQIGQSVRQAGAVTNHFARRMAEAKDTVDLARVDTMLRTSLADHQGMMDSGDLPETQWVPAWQERVKGLSKNIESLGLSPRARKAVDADFIRFTGSSSIAIARAATTRSLEVGRGTLLNSVQAAFEDGDYDVSEALVQRGVKSGLLRADEAESQMMKLERGKREEWAVQTLSADPQSFLAQMEESKKSKAPPKEFEWMQPSDVDKYWRAAKSQVGQLQGDTFNNIATAIDAGEITDPTQIESTAGGLLEPRQVKALKRSLLEERGPDPETSNRLLTTVENYDPKADPDRSQYNSIVTELQSESPRAFSGDLRSKLYQRRMGFDKTGQPLQVPEQIRGSVFRRIDDLFGAGQFGKFETGDPGKKKVVDESAKSQAWSKALAIKDAFRSYQPKDPNSFSEANEWLAGQLRTENLGIGAQSLSQPATKQPGILSRSADFIWNNVLHDSYTGAEPDAPPSPDDINKKLGGK